MDEAVKGAAIKANSRADLLGNQLVVVAPKQVAFDKLALTRTAGIVYRGQDAEG